MEIDFKKEAEKLGDDLIKDLTTLINIDSVRDDEHKTTDFPLGPGPAKALNQVLAFGARDGFITKNVENMAGHIEYGSGDEILGILGHVDVVPAGEGWNTDPFNATIKDGKIYGRGSSDDKGPSLAAYYGLKLIKDLKLPVSKKVRFIFGTDEESNWEGINKYLEVEQTPDYGFSPDAEFPLINGEKGIVTFKITFNQSNEQKVIIKSFKSGIRVNMVPQTASVILDVNNIDANKVREEFSTFVSKNQLSGDIIAKNDDLTLVLNGKGSHAMDPSKGINAATYLASFINTLELNEKESNYFSFINNKLHLDFIGEKLGINFSHDIMGPLSSSPDIYDYDANKDASTILVNVRYPEGKSDQDLVSLIQNTLPSMATVQVDGHAQPPHFVSADDKLVKTLVETYRDYYDDNSEPITIGGGTYGRILDRGVAFGGMFPGRENVMHQPNEYIIIEDLLLLIAIYADAIYRLIK
ncbi:dipeptidase PepV [Companilactobacillus sp. RD055328]|uniref:dipeptidase PepV n=1 Tax=Companilactobacillus sp. RD055328 TaxID=2916634 RepID=UPI001FC85FEC|nr:dipeptidase PepV [Companilactobacillus sp. RD055328]GKQ42086.1 dipeptidase PepV [Companilactobacillus sp. RD055328]